MEDHLNAKSSERLRCGRGRLRNGQRIAIRELAAAEEQQPACPEQQDDRDIDDQPGGEMPAQ